VCSRRRVCYPCLVETYRGLNRGVGLAGYRGEVWGIEGCMWDHGVVGRRLGYAMWHDKRRWVTLEVRFAWGIQNVTGVTIGLLF
jgi:hypothetical protein